MKVYVRVPCKLTANIVDITYNYTHYTPFYLFRVVLYFSDGDDKAASITCSPGTRKHTQAKDSSTRRDQTRKISGEMCLQIIRVEGY